VRDFVAVTELVRAPGVLVVNPSLPARDLAQFIAYLKANPGKLNYSSPGNGTIGHMWGELFRSSTGTTITHVAYKGAADALRDTIGGNVQASFDQVASSLPHIQAGKLRALAVSSERRLDMLPEVPTFREAGLPSNNEPSWFGLVAPAGTPAPVVARIQAAAAAAVREPAVTARLLDLALFPSGSTPQSFAAQIRDEIAKMKKVAEFAARRARTGPAQRPASLRAPALPRAGERARRSGGVGRPATSSPAGARSTGRRPR
jgi:tripartite-type tricarboxylate transporter receptor subunit TctC